MSRVCKDTSARGLRLRGHYLMVDRSRLGKGLALSLLAVLVGCGQQDLPPPSPPAVTVTQPVQSDVREYGIFTGIARAVESVEIRARVAGTLEKVSFEPSQLVKTGDMLFVIEREQYQAARDEALAYLKSAEAELARAESDLQRLQRAVATSAVSESDVDLAQAFEWSKMDHLRVAGS